MSREKDLIDKIIGHERKVENRGLFRKHETPNTDLKKPRITPDSPKKDK